MTTSSTGTAPISGTTGIERVPCDVCHHDIPLSEAFVAEATDYVVHFCGLECYDRWRRRREAV